MPESELRLIKRWEKYLSIDEVNSVPKGLRGFYVLYKHSKKTDSYNVVYVGMSSAGSITVLEVTVKLVVHGSSGFQ